MALRESETERANNLLDENKLNAVLAEYNMLREEMRMFVGFHRRDTQIFFGLIGGLIIAILSKIRITDVSVLIIIIPSLIFLYLVMQIFNLHMVSVEAKACARIEKRVHKLFGEKTVLMDWESNVARKWIRGVQSPTPIITASFLVLLILVFVIFSMKSYENYGYISVIVHSVELAIIIISSFLWAKFELFSEIGDVYQIDVEIQHRKTTQQTGGG